MEFTTYRFKDCIAEIIDNRGRNPDKYYDSEKYPVIDNYLIKNELHPVVENANRFLSQSQFDNFLRGYVTKDDLLMTLVGNGIGNVSLSPNDKIAIVQNTVGFRLNQELLDSHFAFYYFKTINSAVRNLDRGASQPSVNRTDVLRLKIQVPTINTQKQIADILSTYDELIEKNNKRIKLLEQMAENLYKEWFVRFRFPGYETAEFENGIPVGWEIKRMNDFCYVTDGTHDSPKPCEDGVPLITGKCLSNGFIDFDEAYLISVKDHEKIKKRSGLSTGDILFSNIGTVGNCCIVNYNQEFSVKNVIIFKPESIVKTAYLYYWMTSHAMQEIFATQTNGASQQFVGLTFMRQYKVLVPNKEILNAFGNLILSILEQKEKIYSQNINLIKQRDLLLPRLMSGKLEV